MRGGGQARRWGVQADAGSAAVRLWWTETVAREMDRLPVLILETFNEASTRALDVVPHGQLQTGQVSIFQRVDNRFMFGAFDLEARGPIGLAGVDTDNLQVRVHPFVGFGQTPVAGRFDEQLVEAAVVLFMAFPVLAGHNGPRQLGEQAAHFGAQFGRGAFDGTLRGQALERGAQIEGLLDILGCQLGNEGPAARADFHEPFGAELLDGVADGSEGDAEFFGNFVHLEALAGVEELGEDRLAEGLIDFIGGARPGQPRKFHTRSSIHGGEANTRSEI